MSKTINNQKKFVVNQDKKIAKRINDDLSIIQQIILEEYSDPNLMQRMIQIVHSEE